MKIIKEEINKYPERAGSNMGYLELAKKNERGIPTSTGVHTVKLIGGEMGERTTKFNGTEEGIWLTFKENGEKVKYFVPKLGKNGNFHYLFEKFQNIEEGSMLEMEFQRSGNTCFIDVKEVQHEADEEPPIDAYEPDFESLEY
jgi:hypothetical protein